MLITVREAKAENKSDDLGGAIINNVDTSRRSTPGTDQDVELIEEKASKLNAINCCTTEKGIPT